MCFPLNKVKLSSLAMGKILSGSSCNKEQQKALSLRHLQTPNQVLSVNLGKVLTGQTFMKNHFL